MRRLERVQGESRKNEDAPERLRERSNGRRGHHISSACTQRRASGAGQGTAGGPELNDRPRIACRGQENVLEDSFVVTSLHNRPWGAGDDNSTIGVFFSEEEAKAAAHMHFQRTERQAGG